MRIQHPKATDAIGGWPGSAVRLPSTRRAPVTDGYVDVPDEHADAAMDALEEAYGVEYDRDSGDVVTDDAVAPDEGGVPPKDPGSMDYQELYSRAQELDVPGRSNMDTEELRDAIAQQED